MTLSSKEQLFPGRSEIAALMRAKDWSPTTLGSPETWSNSLRTIVRVLLTSRFAMWVGWGPDLSFLYNDAYAAMTLSAKHPWALMFAGASVVTAANARQALAALDENTFDVAVLDIGMPEVDGHQLLHQIRRRPDDRQGRLPAAALTAYARSIDRTRSLKGGFQIHLSKPVQPTELAAAVLTLSGKIGS